MGIVTRPLTIALAAVATAWVVPVCVDAEPTTHSRCDDIGLASCPEPVDAELPPPHDMLTWTPEQRVVGFRNTYRLYPGDVFHTRTSSAQPLSAAKRPLGDVHYRMDGRTFDLRDYLEHQSVTGLLILKDGQIAFEYYGRGNTERSLWTSRSVAKSVVSVLVGIAVREDLIHSLDDPVAQYVPEVDGSAWDGVTIRNLLQHTSGVTWNEDYADPSSDFAALTYCEARAQPYACVLDLLKSLKRRPSVRPGQVWSYNTAGAWLLGRALERAAGMTLARYLETRLWSRYPMESDGVWQALIPGESDMGGHGFNATLRDWGRFGLFVARGGRLPDGTALLPVDWLRDSITWTRAEGSVTAAAPSGQFGYQWWYAGLDPEYGDPGDTLSISRGSFWTLGIFGQAIAINPAEKLVMVQWSAWQQAELPASLYDEQALFYAAVAHALRGPG